MRLLLVLLTGLVLAQSEGSPTKENDVVPEKKSMRSMDMSYFRDVKPWRSSYQWFKRSGPDEKKSMMSMDRSLARGASMKQAPSSWWGKRSMWSMDRANQRNARFYKRSDMQEKQALLDYLRGLSDTEYKEAISLLEQLFEESEQELEHSEGDRGRVKRGDVVPEKKSIRSMDRSYFRDVRPWRSSYQWFKRWGKRSKWSMDRANETNARFYKRNVKQEKHGSVGVLDYLRQLSDTNNNDAISPEALRPLLGQPEEQSEQELEQSEGDVDGALGDGRWFNPNTVEWMGFVNHVKDSSGCCKECQKYYPGSQMFTFGLQSKSCYCYKMKLGKKPSTYAASPYSDGIAGLCENHRRVRRGEPFIPAMGAPSPPIAIFSRGSGIDINRLIPSNDKTE